MNKDSIKKAKQKADRDENGDLAINAEVIKACLRKASATMKKQREIRPIKFVVKYNDNAKTMTTVRRADLIKKACMKPSLGGVEYLKKDETRK